MPTFRSANAAHAGRAGDAAGDAEAQKRKAKNEKRIKNDGAGVTGISDSPRRRFDCRFRLFDGAHR